jgi:uncharacterized membrane protein
MSMSQEQNVWKNALNLSLIFKPHTFFNFLTILIFFLNMGASTWTLQFSFEHHMQLSYVQKNLIPNAYIAKPNIYHTLNIISNPHIFLIFGPFWTIVKGGESS